MSEFESFRCMISSEDSRDEGPAFCNYPKCWLEECPHKQARDRLAEAEKDAEKWRFLHLEAEEPLSCQMCRNAHDAVLRKLDSATSRLRAASELIEKWRERNLHHCYYCADELEAALGIEASISETKERRKAEDG